MPLDPESGATPDIQVNFAKTTSLGGISQGVLGVAEPGGKVTIVSGWDWYVGVNEKGISKNKYDLQTVVTHEIAHVIGFGHSKNAGSVMYPSITAGDVRRSFANSDLVLADTVGLTQPEKFFVEVPDGASAWQNQDASVDVSGDYRLSPMDAMLLINRLNAANSGASLDEYRGAGEAFVDVNGDGRVTPSDVIVVINALNSNVSIPADPALVNQFLPSDPPSMDGVIDWMAGRSSQYPDTPTLLTHEQSLALIDSLFGEGEDDWWKD